MGRRQRPRRALMVLGLGVLACRPASEPERAGTPQPFHDQLLYEGTLDAALDRDSGPDLLAVDVRRDAIHVGRFGSRTIFARDGSTELPDLDLDGVPIRVPGDDRFLVWHRRQSANERRIFAARSEQPEQSWPVLDYLGEQAISEPIVVGDRVAVVTEHAIAHAPILGGAPGLLALSHSPDGLLSSDAGRLVWVAREGSRELVMSTDASFSAVEVEHEQRRSAGLLVGAVLVGDSIVFASDRSGGEPPFELVVWRKRADGSMVEVLRRPDPAHTPWLVADGSQAWLITPDELWWIGADTHAQMPRLAAPAGKAMPNLIGADDGLLLWHSDDGLHVAGQPMVEFHQPFRMQLAIGGEDNDIWDHLGVPEAVPEAVPSKLPPPVVELKRLQIVDGSIDRDMVRRIVRARINEIRSCYHAGLKRDPALRGRIELEFVVGPGGRVAEVEDRTGDELADPEVSRCAARALRRWQFPKPREGGSATVRYSLELRPGD